MITTILTAVCLAGSAIGAPPPAAPATLPASQSSGAQQAAPRAALDELLVQWKDLLKKLRDLRQQFSLESSTPEQQQQLGEQYLRLIREGEQLLPKLVAAAEAAYQGGGMHDSDLARFLVEVARDSDSRDNFPVAARLARLLVDHGAGQQKLIELAGTASFKINDFDAAEKYLKQAAGQGRLSPEGQQALQIVAGEKVAWQREQKLRAAEAKADDLPRVKIETRHGDIVVELFENEAPNTVANFISLVDKGYYNGLTFHRVLPGFMAQAGCPKGDGSGGPGYTIHGEAGDAKVYRHHFRGSLSMALEKQAPDSGGSQFFLTFVPTHHLDGVHTVFGRVIEGMDVLPRLMRRDPQNGATIPGDKILKATVLRKRNHPYEPQHVNP